MQFNSNFTVNPVVLNQVKTALNKVQINQFAWMQVIENANLTECEKALSNFCSFNHLLVLGIGGSALGTLSVIQALNKTDKITICDHIDPELIDKQITTLNWENTAVCVISKSGETIETMLQLALVEKILAEKFPLDNKCRIICITGKNSLLHQHAQKHNYYTLFVPEKIGGRFSVLTPVGIFPLLFAGIKVPDLLKGAETVCQIDTNNNQVLVNLIANQYEAYYHQQRSVLVLMTYQKKLIGLLDWYRQLIAESLGKNLNTGITPLLAFGSTDQHSQIQLYTEGPHDKLISFLDAPYQIPNLLNTNLKILNLDQSINFKQTQQALETGTKISLQKHGRPFLAINLTILDEFTIGKYLMTYMLQIAVLADLLNVNAFNQPGVEEGKKATMAELI